MTCLLLLITAVLQLPGGGEVPVPDESDSELRPFMETWCLDCHQGSRARSDLDLEVVLDRLDQGEVPASLERIIDRLQRRDMPPEEDPRPDDAAYEIVILELEGLVSEQSGRPPARTTMRRLGRHEYANTIRDLLGVEIEVERELPADEIGDGFDNNGDALSVPPLLLEKYFDLAESTTSGVIARSGESDSTVSRYQLGQLATDDRASQRRSSWILSTRGGVYATHSVPADGPYVIRASVRAQQAGPDPVMMAILVDGRLLERFPIDTGLDVPRIIEIETDLRAGMRRVEISFLNDYYDPENPDPAQRDRNAAVRWIEVEGPVRSVYPTGLQAQLMERFGSPEDPAALRSMVAHLADRAWRRPVEAGEIDRLLALSSDESPPWDRLRTCLTTMLVHPRFLFRLEAEPGSGLAQRSLDDWEIATRLSYFLWSTMPDSELRRAASAGELSTAAGRASQVRRMLDHERSRNLARHFATQWLQIRSVRDAMPDDTLFPGVDDRLLGLMSEETERFFDEILRSRLPVSTLLDGDWTWLNQPLARHYGIEGVRGNRMRKVSLPEVNGDGTGILRHGSILVATSNPTRTSPVKRGKWVLEALLDDAPPPAPPGVGGLPEDGRITGDLSLREMLLHHRNDPECAACHEQMDALGFALEPFDAVGRSRSEDGGIPIDALGELPDGRLVDGPTGLRDVLLDAIGRARFERSLARHLATYALGRGLDRRDEPMLEQLVGSLENEPTLERLILELVETDAFLRRSAANAGIMFEEGNP
jgi:hypothetical protein